MFKDISKSIHHFPLKYGILNTVRCNDNSSLSLLLNRLQRPTAPLRWAVAYPGSYCAREPLKQFFKKLHFSSCFFLRRVVIYSRFKEKKYFRVWRSLVSRLTGGQEAAGSSPVTRTKNPSISVEIEGFFLFLFTFRFGSNMGHPSLTHI